MKSVRLENVSKSYGDYCVLRNFNFSVDAGIFFALLGPSGCGKTTVLRVIAGLENVDEGKIFLGEQDVTNLPPYQRKINTVFQRQALFPHMTVKQNIAYGLKIRGLPDSEVRERVAQQIQIVNLKGLENKYPQDLSGGQQQRVALARALVVEPEVLLFDEPLSALDLKLKERMLIECVNLQYKLKTTFIYITHDQKEALTVADKMAIMNFDGKIEQIGSPKEVYEKPQSRFVADFIGNTTILSAEVLDVQGKKIILEVPRLGTIICQKNIVPQWALPGRQVFISLRPERVKLAREPQADWDNTFQAVVANTVYAGKYLQYTLELAGGYQLSSFYQADSTQESIFDDVKIFCGFAAQDIVLLEC